MNRRSFSAVQMLTIENLKSSLDMKNDPIAHRLYNTVLHCNDEEQIIEILIQGLKAYSETLNVVKTSTVKTMDLRGTNTVYILDDPEAPHRSETK